MHRYLYSKVGMTTVFSPIGVAMGVTVLKQLSSKIVRHETLPDGRKMVVVQYAWKSKPITRGWIVESLEAYPLDGQLPEPQWQTGEKLKVQGSTKGRGFQDAMTRHGFGGGPASHGSRFHRAPGSVGMRTEPGRTIKGKKLPGQYGNVTQTVRNVRIVDFIDDSKNVVIWGAVPGPTGSILVI